MRTLPAKLLEINRQILNNQLARDRGGKVSFTHLIGFAVVWALQRVPSMNASFGLVDGKPSVVRHTHVNLGLAIDQQKADGTRTLLVPNVKSADTLDFAAFHAAYEDLVRRARINKLTVDDFVDTTVSLTNPGTIGTLHSVPRLMPGQGVIVGVGAITYPPEYEGADPLTLAEIGVSKTVTLTSTSVGAPTCVGNPCRVQFPSPGTFTYTWEARDAAGNATSCETAVNVPKRLVRAWASIISI